MDKFKLTCGIASEHFGDNYIVIVKGPEGGMMWRSGCETWGVGAAKRYIDFIRDKDKFEMGTLLGE